jgi:hypothetical protein
MLNLYKYQRLPKENPEQDRNIMNLFNHQLWLSSRKLFNDPFDSYINFILNRKIVNSVRIKRLIKKENPDVFVNKFEDIFNKKIDSYAICCFSSVVDNNLLWSHYAGDHTGFCIEFDGTKIECDKISYERKLFEIDLFDVILKMETHKYDEFLGKLFKQGLTTKLAEWEYEAEYRYIEQGKIPLGAPGVIKQYPEEWVKSITFGGKISRENKNYIIKSLPFQTKFKQAVFDRKNSKIVIQDL